MIEFVRTLIVILSLSIVTTALPTWLRYHSYSVAYSTFNSLFSERTKIEGQLSVILLLIFHSLFCYGNGFSVSIPTTGISLSSLSRPISLLTILQFPKIVQLNSCYIVVIFYSITPSVLKI